MAAAWPPWRPCTAPLASRCWSAPLATLTPTAAPARAQTPRASGEGLLRVLRTCLSGGSIVAKSAQTIPPIPCTAAAPRPPARNGMPIATSGRSAPGGPSAGGCRCSGAGACTRGPGASPHPCPLRTLPRAALPAGTAAGASGCTLRRPRAWALIAPGARRRALPSSSATRLPAVSPGRSWVLLGGLTALQADF